MQLILSYISELKKISVLLFAVDMMKLMTADLPERVAAAQPVTMATTGNI